MSETDLSKRHKLIIYLLAVLFWLNLFIFFGLFIEIVFPNLPRKGVWSYIQLAAGLALFFAVAESLREKTFIFFVGFNVVVAIVNSIAIWRNFFFH